MGTRGHFLILLLGFFALSACSEGFKTNSAELASQTETERSTPPGDGPAMVPTPTASPEPVQSPTLGICSKLDFVGVEWPKTLVQSDRKAMALALNITGSFEGGAGWANLGNNFDDQGMSLGLNQQNFGQGTLQPMLQSMVQKQPSVMQSLFSTANLKSLTAMLKPFSAATAASASDESKFEVLLNDDTFSEELFPDQEALSPLDEGFEVNTISASDAKTAASVTWAKNTLYKTVGGSVFKTDWKNSFLSVAVTAPYRSLQVQAALAMFKKAGGYFDSLKFTELRSLLMMYDIVVQNGGLNSTHLAQYRQYVAANPQATETARLTKLLEIRIVSVRSQFKNDVRSRKMTIINGTGTVHGSKRDLQKEYCFKANELVP